MNFTLKARYFRWLQFITGVNRIHHIHYSYGYKLPFLKLGFFKRYDWRIIKDIQYHNCTKSGIY